MDNLLDIYTKLKLKVGTEIQVTYYTQDGIKHTEDTILSDITYFSHIRIVHGKKGIISIPFFSPNIIIESITFKEAKHPVYFNFYLQQLESTNPFDSYNQLEPLMTSCISCDKEILNQRKTHIKQYLTKKHYVEYDDLFFSEKQKEEFIMFFNMLVQELKKYAIANGFDSSLKHIYSGGTSIVYEIGDKIIKIGKPRRTAIIPYCEYLLQPIINRTLEFDGFPIHLEVTQKVITLDNENGYDETKEDEQCQKIMAELTEHLHSIGLKLQDMIPANIGILLEDNRIHFSGITFDIGADHVTSIENNNNKRILPKGSPVILDLDCIEIVDIKKYIKYLINIGLDRKQIKRTKQKSYK